MSVTLLKRLLLCAVLVIGMGGSAMAGSLTGNGLLTFCENDATSMVCKGYLQGVHDTLEQNAINGMRACIPDSVTLDQRRDVVVSWLKANPSLRRVNASSLVAQAWGQAFPCKK